MTPALLLAALLSQDVDERVDALLRAFELQQEFEERALFELAARLVALGTTAADPIARRLEEDLADGDPSPEAPALLRALDGRTEEMMVLEGLRLRAMGADAAERARLMKLLGEAGTSESLMLLEDLAAVADATARPAPIGDEPKVTILADPPAGSPRTPAPAPNENPDTPSPDRGSAYNILLGLLGAGIAILLLSFLRKGPGR